MLTASSFASYDNVSVIDMKPYLVCIYKTGPQIKMCNWIIIFSTKIYVVGTRKNHLNDTVHWSFSYNTMVKQNWKLRTLVKIV